MRILEEILDEMEHGVPWDTIIIKYRSKSQIYEALRIFLKKHNKTIAEIIENKGCTHDSLTINEDGSIQCLGCSRKWTKTVHYQKG